MNYRELLKHYREVLRKVKILNDREVEILAEKLVSNLQDNRNLPLELVFNNTLQETGFIEKIHRNIIQSLIYQTAIGYGIIPQTIDFKILHPKETFLQLWGQTRGEELSQNLYVYIRKMTSKIYETFQEAEQGWLGYQATRQKIQKIVSLYSKNQLTKWQQSLLESLQTARKKDVVKILAHYEEIYIKKLSNNRVYKKLLEESIIKQRLNFATTEQVNFAELTRDLIEARATSLAERIAITENSRVFEQANYNRMYENPFSVALKFNLSSSHKVPDECDVYANTDFYGMGEGVYPKEEAPYLPIHPNGRSYYTELTERDIPEVKYEMIKDPVKVGEEKGLYKSQLEVLAQNRTMQYFPVNKNILNDL